MHTPIIIELFYHICAFKSTKAHYVVANSEATAYYMYSHTLVRAYYVLVIDSAKKFFDKDVEKRRLSPGW